MKPTSNIALVLEVKFSFFFSIKILRDQLWEKLTGKFTSGTRVGSEVGMT